MKTQKLLPQVMGLTIVVLSLTGCSRVSTEPIATPTPNLPTATAVPPTATLPPPTATSLPPTPTPAPPTAPPLPPTGTAVPPTTTAKTRGSLQPLHFETCRALADALEQTLGIEMILAEAPFEDILREQSGTGCQITAGGTGLDFENLGVIDHALREMLPAQGWQEDISFAADGPGSMFAGFRRANQLCLLAVSSGPAEEQLCANDEPFATCWQNLTPRQQRYTITLNCVQDTSSPTEPAASLNTNPEANANSGVSINSFTAEVTDNVNGGKIVAFHWDTSGATSVRIFNGATFTRFGTWWTDLPPDGTLVAEITDTMRQNPRMDLFATDAQGNEVSQGISIEMPCEIEDLFRGNNIPPGTICPAVALETVAAEQRFENGFMIWLQDLDGGTILVFYNEGRTDSFADTWQAGQPESDPNITPPGGLYQPMRGFGKVWRENNLRDSLGWAVEEEQNFYGKWQRDNSPSPAADHACLVNRDLQLICIAGPISGGRWEFRQTPD
ncbi:MAG: hypothetical protein JW953_16520 [Anaerolineae bacterium]|nr:hypothetical protein [Anaerolineae bacterium]